MACGVFDCIRYSVVPGVETLGVSQVTYSVNVMQMRYRFVTLYPQLVFEMLLEV